MEAIRLLKRRPWGTAGAVILLALVLVAALSPVIAPYHFNEISINNRLEPPGRDFIFGTDNLGRDIFSRFLYGSRPYVTAGLIATGIATVLGFLLALLSANIRGKTDSILRTAIFIASLLAILVVLFILLSFVMRFAFHPLIPVMKSVENPLLTTVITGLLLAFVFLTSVYSAARRAITTHASGHLLAPLFILTLVNLGVAVGAAVLVIAPVSYLGFGVPPPFPEWGNMLSSTGLRYLNEAPWMITYPQIGLVLATIGVILFGLALYETWFPRLPERLVI